MNHTDIELMNDVILEERHVKRNNTNVSAKNKNKNNNPHISSKLKVELQTLRISEESEQQLYNTLKHIYGSFFDRVLNFLMHQNLKIKDPI